MHEWPDRYLTSETVPERLSEPHRQVAELDAVMQPTLDELRRTVPIDRAFILLLDSEQEVLRVAAQHDGDANLFNDFPAPLIQALRRGNRVLIDNTQRDAHIPQTLRERFLEQGMLALALIPLVPTAGVLAVSLHRPLSDADIAELVPHTSRLAELIAGRLEARQLRQSREQHVIEKEWLWWMVNGVPDPVLLTDASNNVILNNLPAERLFTATAEDSAGKRRAIQLNNVLLSAALSRYNLDQGLDQGAGLGRELTLVDPIEGNELLFEMICQPATNLANGHRGLVSVLKDVTDLRQATEQVRQRLLEFQTTSEEARRERDRLNLILENVADPIVVTDVGGQFILVNPPAERLLRPRAGGPSGLEAESTDRIVRTNAAKLSSFLSQLRLAPARTLHQELQVIDPDTEERLTMAVTATEVFDALGQVTAIVAVLHDLTRARELEDRRVQQQLFETQKLAAIGRLIAAVAHEVNNPLEAIKNALYLVVEGLPADEPNRRFLEIASQETQRVSAIIREMLGFYRPTADRAPVSLNQVIEESLSLLQRQLRQHHVAVRFEPDRTLPLVLASPDQLKQVFLNLFLNAQEAMPQGGSLSIVTRRARESDEEFLAGQYVLIQVRDTGVGIPEDEISRIFEPFFSTKSESRGTGLGLWVSLGIIHQHNGQIKVRSRPGRGTTFTIALPLEEDAWTSPA